MNFCSIDMRDLPTVLGPSLLCAIALMFVGFAVGAAPASAAVNKQVNFQGKITGSNGLAVPDGTYNLEIKLHNDASAVGGAQGVCSGSCLWMETRTMTDRVAVTRGLFSVQLGSVAPLTGFNFDQDPLHLSVRVGGTSGTPSWDGEMTPRQRLAAAPQAIHAFDSSLLGGQPGSFYTNASNLSSGALSDARLSANVALRNVNNNFSTGQTVAGTVSATDLTCSDCLGATDVASGAIGTAEIADGAVSVLDLAFDPATQAELDSHKTSADHDARYYTETELDAVGALNTATNPVEWTKLKNVPAGFADGVDDVSATASDIACTGCVGTTDLAAGAVTDAKMAPGTFTPIGGLMPFAGATAPAGWRIADGSAMSVAAFPALSGVIGETYGVGSDGVGGDSFSLPDFRARVPVGLSAANTAFDVRGEVGGAQSTTLAIGNLPAHNHPVSDPGHAHDSRTYPSGWEVGGFALTNGGNGYADRTMVTGGGYNVAGSYTGVTVGNTGSGAAFTNVQPYQTVNYIIRVS